MKNHTNINPSFFGRLYAIDASFATIAEEIRKDGIRAERGDNHYYRNISDTLDLLELLFLYGKHPDLLIEHFAFPHVECEWGRMMEKDLMVDQKLERHAKDWILFSWKGKLIGGTSPYTLVYTVPDIRNRNIQLTGGQGRLLFDDQNLLLSKRDLRFQQYLVSLYRYHNLPSSMHSYLKEIEKLLTHHPVIQKEDFDNLPDFIDIPGAVVNGIPLKCDPSITDCQNAEEHENHVAAEDNRLLEHRDDNNRGLSYLKQPTENKKETTVVKCFMAGSTSLEQERNLFRAVVSKADNRWETYNIKSYDYQDFSRSYQKVAHQDTYNEFIVDCTDFMVFVITGKIGSITRKELEVAAESYDSSGHPQIFIYVQKDAFEMGVWDDGVKEWIDEKQLYVVKYDTLRDLQNAISEDLNDYIIHNRHCK